MNHDDEIQMEPVWNAASALKQYVTALILSDEEKHLLLETIYFELRVMYLHENLVTGYEHVEGMDAELDRLTTVLLDAMEGLYEMKEVLDLEELLEELEHLWLQTPPKEKS